MATRTDLGKWMITNGGEYDERTEYEALTMVMYNNSTFITLKTVTGVEPTDDRKNYILMAKGFDPTALASVRAKDTHGVLSLGTPTQPPAEVSAQELIDGLAAPAFDDAGTATGITGFQNFIDSVKSGMKILDFFKNLKTGLKFVLHTGQLVNNGLCNDPGKYPLDAAYGKTLLDMITKCQTDITSLNSELESIPDFNTPKTDLYLNNLWSLSVGSGHNASGSPSIIADAGYANEYSHPAFGFAYSGEVAAVLWFHRPTGRLLLTSNGKSVELGKIEPTA